MDRELSPEEEDRIRDLRERYKKNADDSADDDPDQDSEEEEEDEDRPKGCFLRFIKYFAVFAGFFGFIALLVWVLDAFIIPSYVHDKDIVQVPDLIGMPQDEAAELLLDIGLTWEKNGEQYDPQFKSGSVLIQNPEAGINVKAGRPIYLTISKGMEKAKVPYMIGMSSREAMIQLVSRGLVMGKVDYENSEMFDRDIVLSQSIENGREIELGDTIHLTVSKGSELTIIAPELVGLDLDMAKQIILDNELLIGNISYQAEDTFMAGTVLWQYPSSGNETLKGTYVDLIVTGSGPTDGIDDESGSQTESELPQTEGDNNPDVMRVLEEIWKREKKK
jgi:serine/threonine-protein kinase